MNRNIVINNCNINYEDNGTAKPPIVFIHGNSQSLKVFKNQLNDTTLNKNYRLIALDLPGHGSSEKAPNPEGTYNFGGYGKFIIDFCEELKIQDALFVGSSLGGNVLIEAIQNLAAKGLLVFGTAPIETIADFGEATLVNPEDLAYLFNETYSEQDIEFVLKSQFSENFNNTKISDFLREDILKNDGKSRVFLGKSLGECLNKNEKIILQELKIPFSMALGKNEYLINIDYLKKIEAPTLWQNKVIEIASSGHSIQMENHKDFNNMLFDFANFVYKQ